MLAILGGAINSSRAQAQTYTWDGGGVDGNWNTGANWATNVAPTETTWYTFQFGGTLQLNSNNNLVGGSGGWNANDIEFLAGAGAFTLTGNNVDLLGRSSAAAGAGLAEVTNNSSNTQTINLNLEHRSDFNTGLNFNATGGNIVVNGAILNATGSTPVTINGPNTVTFAGNNTYDDATVINSGVLQIGSGGTSGSLGTGATTINTQLVFNRSDSLTVSSAIGGTGTLTQSGGASSVTILTGANNYGATVINSGTLQIGNGTTGTLGAGNVTNNGTLTINRSNAITINNDISGSGAVIKNGLGVLTFGGNNSYAGTTTVNAGVLLVNSATALGNTTGPTTVADGASLALAGGITVTGETANIIGAGETFNGALRAESGTATWAGNVNLDNATSRLGARAGATLIVSGAIQNGVGGNSLNISGESGTGIVHLSGNSSYTGSTNIIRGILRLGTNNALPTTTTLDVDNSNANENAVFEMNGFNQTIANLQRSNTGGGTGTATVTNSSATLSTLTINNSAANTFNGAITGNLAITKTNTGDLALTGTNTFTGGINILNGSVTSTAASSLGNASGGVITIGDTSGSNNATLNFGNATHTALNTAGIVVAAGSSGTKSITTTATGTYTYNGPVTLNDNLSVGLFAGSTLQLNGAISGAGGITKSGGTLTLGGTTANSYTGTTTVNSGVLSLNKSANVDAIAGNLSIAGGSVTFGASAQNQFADTINVTMSSGVLNGTAVNVGSVTHTETFANLTVTGGTFNSGNSSLWTITGAGGFTGGTGATFIGNSNDGGAVTRFGSLSLKDMNGAGGITSPNTFAVGGNTAATVRIDGGGLSLENSNLLLSLGDAGARLALNGNVVTTGTGANGILRTGSGSAGPRVELSSTAGNFSRTFTIGATAPLTIDVAITNGAATAGGIIKDGAGTMTLSGSNSYTGATEINAGILSVGSLGNGGANSHIGASTNAASNLQFGGGTLSYTGANVTTNRGFTLNAGGGTIEVVTAATNLTFSGNATGAGGLTKSGAGILTLSNFGNDYAGTTTINNGTLRLGAAGVLPDTTDVNIVSPGVLDLNGRAESIDGLAGNGTVTSGVAGAIIFTVGANNTAGGANFSGVIQNGSGTVALTKIGTGTQTLSGANTYAGATRVEDGTLEIATGGSIANTPSVTVGVGTGTDTLLLTNTGSHTLGTGDLTVGSTGIGIVQHNAGNVTVGDAATDAVRIGVGAQGTYNINNGATSTLSVGPSGARGNVIVGQSNVGFLNVGANAAVNVGDLIVGQLAGSSGTVNQTGGTINVTNTSTMIVGDAGTGVENHSGGTTNVAGNLILGNQSTGNGTYNLSQGVALSPAILNVALNTSVGAQGTSGSGNFSQAGGTHNLAGNLTIGNSTTPAAQNSYTLSGGTLNFGDRLDVSQASAAPTNAASTLKINADGDFNFNGGTLMNVTTIDVTSAPGSIFQQDGGRFVVGVDGGLAIRDGIGLDASRAMTTIVGGSYDQNGGTLAIDIFGKRIRTIGGEPIGPTDPGSNPITGLITDSDLLYIANGNATLDGTLAINLNGVKPGPLAWYDVLVANQIFVEDGFNVMGLDVWRIIPDPTTPGRQILQVATPEPASIALWSLAAVVVGGAIVVRRRKA